MADLLAMGWVLYYRSDADLAKPPGSTRSLATTLVRMGIVLVLGRDWLKVIGPPRLHLRDLTFRFLEAFLAGYFIVLTAAVLAMAVLGWIVWRSRSRSRSTPARWLLLCGSIVLGLVMAEAVAVVWLSWVHRLPALSRHFSGPAHPRNEILIVVIGESSALGVPYDGWLSIGMIVGRELQKAIPSRRFRVEILAEKGATLEAMHQKLACLTERPDALIIFSGHNEFLARFSMAEPRGATISMTSYSGTREPGLNAPGDSLPSLLWPWKAWRRIG